MAMRNRSTALMKRPKTERATIPAHLRKQLEDVMVALRDMCGDDEGLTLLCLTKETAKKVEALVQEHEGEMEWALGFLHGVMDTLGITPRQLLSAVPPEGAAEDGTDDAVFDRPRLLA